MELKESLLNRKDYDNETNTIVYFNKSRVATKALLIPYFA